jgi:hypothetical protein
MRVLNMRQEAEALITMFQQHEITFFSLQCIPSLRNKIYDRGVDERFNLLEEPRLSKLCTKLFVGYYTLQSLSS